MDPLSMLAALAVLGLAGGVVAHAVLFDRRPPVRRAAPRPLLPNTPPVTSAQIVRINPTLSEPADPLPPSTGWASLQEEDAPTLIAEVELTADPPDAPLAIEPDTERLREMEDRLAARDEAIELLQEQADGLHAAAEESALAELELRRDVERRRSLEHRRIHGLEEALATLQGDETAGPPNQLRSDLMELAAKLTTLRAHDQPESVEDWLQAV